MNCHDAQHQLFANDAGALDNTQRAALEAHVAHCADCGRIRDELVTVFATWRTQATNVRVPDAEREWHSIRRRIRGGVEVGNDAAPARTRRTFFPWLLAPLGVAAACAVAFLAMREPPKTGTMVTTQVARADYVEAPGRNASTMVYVDEKSGWLFVVASDQGPKQG